MAGRSIDREIARCDSEIANCRQASLANDRPGGPLLGLFDWYYERRMLLMESKEMVDHPSHYGGDTPHEVIKCLEAWGLEGDALLWNAVKYIARSGKKGPKVVDLKKAQFFLARRIETLERQNELGETAKTPLTT